MAAEHAPHVVLLDLRLPDADGIVALEALRADDPDVGVILLTGYADVEIAVRAMRIGASDVLQKPVDLRVLARAVESVAERERMKGELGFLRGAGSTRKDGKELKNPVTLEPPSVQRLIDLASRNADAPVLLEGETGTGKGYVARQIHDRSGRNKSPWVELNCSSMTPTFFESNLFGHERGAFTDAKTAKRGLLEVVGDGTLFLDEIGELSLEIQPRLLKAIEERRFRRLGSTTELRCAARIIVATNRHLEEAVEKGDFRADLYFRLKVLTICLPPLRARPDRIGTLAEQLKPEGTRITPSALAAIADYAWPGNIRELKNALWRAAILADGDDIESVHLGLPEINGGPHLAAGAALHQRVENGWEDEHLASSLKNVERNAIAKALHECSGNRTHAARKLGIARSTLQQKLKQYPEII